MSLENLTLSKLTTEIAGHLGKELDEPFKRVLAEKIDSWRSRLLRNSLQDKPLESKFFRQTLYVPLEFVSPLPSCKTGPVCNVLRSTAEIPTPLRFGISMFDYVGAIDGEDTFFEAAPGTGNYLTSMRYSSRVVTWGWVNRYLEIKNAGAELPMLRIDGVFDKPSDAMRFNCEIAGVGCDYWDQPYPVTGDIAQMIVQSILQVDFNRSTTPSVKEVDVNPQKQAHEPDGR